MACLLQADLEGENTDIVPQNNLLFPKIGLSIYLISLDDHCYCTEHHTYFIFTNIPVKQENIIISQ